MAKTYVITSGKGGVGKTTCAVNLGAALNNLNEEVIVLDANLTTPNLGLYFGSPSVPVSLNHVLQGKADINEAIYEHESGTKIIPASLSLKDLKSSKIEELSRLSKKLKKIADHIILDCAAGLGEEAREAICAADDVLIVTNPNILSVTDSLKTIKLAEELNKDVRGIILNRVKKNKAEMKLDSIKEMLEVPILGIIPEDREIDYSLKKKDAVVNTKPNSKSAIAYQKLAEKLSGKKLPRSFLYKVLSSFGLR